MHFLSLRRNPRKTPKTFDLTTLESKIVKRAASEIHIFAQLSLQPPLAPPGFPPAYPPASPSRPTGRQPEYQFGCQPRLPPGVPEQVIQPNSQCGVGTLPGEDGAEVVPLLGGEQTTGVQLL